MNRKSFFPLLAISLTALVAVGFVVGRNAATRAASAGGALAALPASDFVISIDAQRALNETLPALLASDPATLARLNAKLDEFQRKTGINPRSFESIAIGGGIDAARPGRGSHGVVIARGSFRSDELLEAAFASAKAQEPNLQREEQQYEGRRIFLLYSTRNVADDIKAGKTSAQVQARSRNEKVAVTALDANTIAVGELEGVRAAVDASLGRNRVDEELVRLASETPGAVFSFSGRLPQGVAGKAANNPFEKYFSSIRQFYGSFDADGADARALVNLRTETTEQANDLGQALNALKTLSSFGLAQSSAKANSLGELFKGLSITTLSNEVQISVRVPQTSIAPLIRLR